ncbi:MAG: GntR family transcriptional regulator [Verrucomicrobia bacterium]|nr:GntR family transcriptional regulator [Verrucomicrobiota bacterium]
MKNFPLAHTLPAQLVSTLRGMILSGDLAPGERLREVDLARRFQISRGPIRDTFLQLTGEGLLEARPNAGVRVARAPSDFKRASLVRLRRSLEADCLTLWFENPLPQLLELLSQNLELYRLACEQERFEEVVEVDMAFHHAIVSAAEEGALLSVWRPIISQMFLRYSRHHSLLESYAEHREILDHMRAFRREEAVQSLTRHIQ